MTSAKELHEQKEDLIKKITKRIVEGDDSILADGDNAVEAFNAQMHRLSIPNLELLYKGLKKKKKPKSKKKK